MDINCDFCTYTRPNRLNITKNIFSYTMKVCVIDDINSITGMIEKLLKMNGHECVIINDAHEGLSALEKEIFDVVILDIAMPELSGLDIVDSLCKSGRMKDQKICILTASSVGIDFQKLRDQGVKEILKKPIELETLINILQKVAGTA